MNKKLQKSLTTAMAAAMGAGIVVPTVAAIAAPVATTNGWVKAGTSWNYLKSGKKATGWVKDAGTWYFLNASGTMQTGWVKDAGTWYFLNASGAMKTGWVKDGASWYFLNASGAMQTGWVKDAGTWYYLFNSGSMATNTTVDGWKLDASGAGSLATTPVVPVVPVVPPTTTVSVTSASAISASAIKVVFSSAPADTSKVVFAVSNTGSATTTTTTWNAANTEATLTSAANLPEGTYTVGVKNGTADLGTQTVQITAQRIAKISIDSNILAVVDAGQTGYVGYHVYDQYGVDITSQYLASSGYINWSCGIGQVTSNDKGLLTIKPFGTSTSVLTQFPSCVITAVTQNQTIPASVSSTLNISTTQGTLSDIKLNKITNVDNATPTVGDSETYYIDYTALDMSGNATSDLNLVEKGLITTNTPNPFTLVTSNSELVTAKVVQDPNDSNKAAIQVTINTPNYTLMQDQPVTINVNTYTGKTSALTFTVKRAQALDSFTMMAPSTYVASGETPTIPFVAYDQSGKQLTKYSDLNNMVTFSDPSLQFVENADGTASLQWTAPTNTTNSPIQQTLTASVKNSSKFSTMNVNVEPVVQVDGIQLDNTVVIPRMEMGATQNFDFGFNDGGFNVIDQYGRNIDMINGNTINGATYFVEALLPGQNVTTNGVVTGTPDTSNISFVNGQNIAYAGHEVALQANAAGTATVNFVVMKGDPTNPAAATYTGYSQSQSFTVMTDKDITGYSMDTVAAPYFAAAPVADTAAKAGATAQQINTDDTTELYVYGTNAAGSKVVLKNSNIVSLNSSSADFYTLPDNNYVEIVANQLSDSTKTSSSATISATIMNSYDNRQHTATSTVTSSTAAQVSKSMSYYAYGVDRKDCMSATGITTSGNTVTVDLNGTQNYYGSGAGQQPTSDNFNSISNGTLPENSILNAIAGRELVREDATTGSSHNRGYITIRSKDQYGSNEMNLSSVTAVETSHNAAGVALATVDPTTDTLNFNYMPTTADYVYISGVSTSGLVETVKIAFKYGTVTPVTPTADSTATAAVVLAETTPTVANYNAANALVTALPAGDAVKVALTARLVVVNTTIANAAAGAAALVVAENNLSTAIAADTTEVNAAVPGTATGNYAAADIATFRTAIATAQAAVTNASATTATVVAATTALATARTTFEATAVKAPVGNVLTGTSVQNVFGSYTVTVTVPDATKLTNVSVNGTALVAGTDYTLTGSVVKLVVQNTTDIVTLTDAGTTYTVSR